MDSERRQKFVRINVICPNECWQMPVEIYAGKPGAGYVECPICNRTVIYKHDKFARLKTWFAKVEQVNYNKMNARY